MISKVSKVVAFSLLLSSSVWAAASSSSRAVDLNEIYDAQVIDQRARVTYEKIFTAVEQGSIQRLRNLFIDLPVVTRDVRNHEGATPLHWAVRHGKINVIEWLDKIDKIGTRELVNEQDYKGCTPLHYAAKKGDLAVAKTLCEGFACMNANEQDETGATALHYAVKAGRKEVVILLCEWAKDLSLDVDMLDLTDSTPLHYATIDRFKDIADQRAVVDALIKCGANQNALNTNGDRALSYHARLCFAAFQGNVQAMMVHCTLGTSLHAQDAQGCSPLHYAVMSKNLNAIAFLLERRVPIEVKNNAGQTPFNIAEQLHDQGAKDLLSLYFRASR